MVGGVKVLTGIDRESLATLHGDRIDTDNRGLDESFETQLIASSLSLQPARHFKPPCIALEQASMKLL